MLLGMIDYKNLLVQYMIHIGSLEGTHFTGRSLDSNLNILVRDKKMLKELSKIADEIASHISPEIGNSYD